ncbi:MAG TPA: ATP-binding protein [Gemmataceae bacterium]|jgi:heavy metal sensor kinase|nr:ATP-binding protein [Gemmataceae bacterium]
MSLTGRLTAFFLIALAAVLLGFSGTLYGLAHSHLHRQLDARLDAVLDMLVAAAEFKAGGVEWEPAERRLAPGRSPGPDEVRWLVCDAQGTPVDRSPNLKDEEARSEQIRKSMRTAVDQRYFCELIDGQGQSWHVQQRRLQGNNQSVAPAQAAGQEPAERIYSTLFLVGAASKAPLSATLRSLAWTLIGLSGSVWLLAALLARRLCRRALLPVTNMAEAARTMSAAELDQRLPDPGTGDELEELNQAFNDLLSRLQESFERQRRFAGDASHQLRTPLTAMLGQMEVCLRRERSPEDYRQALAVVHQQAQQLRHIVEMLLFLARADGEARLPDLETIDLAAWLDEYRQRWAGHVREADIQVEAWPHGPVLVQVQPPLLAQLLDNLLDNACKYSAAGSPITLRLARDAGKARLSVEDAGPGIAAVDLPHVFEPFYRSAEMRKRGTAGVGLGLAVAQRVAQAFAGRLTVYSEPGRTTRFTLVLPAIKVTDDAPVGCSVG